MPGEEELRQLLGRPEPELHHPRVPFPHAIRPDEHLEGEQYIRKMLANLMRTICRHSSSHLDHQTVQWPCHKCARTSAMRTAESASPTRSPRILACHVR